MPATTRRIYAGTSQQVPEGGRLLVDAAGKAIGIFRVDGRLYAYENTCAHQGGPVCQGKIIPRVTETIETGGVSRGSRSTLAICMWCAPGTVLSTTSRPERIPAAGSAVDRDLRWKKRRMGVSHALAA